MRGKIIIAIFTCSSVFAIFGCSSEKPGEALEKQAIIPLSPADREKVVAFQKEVTGLENLTDKALKLAGAEIVNIVKGGEISLSLPDLARKAGAECRQTCEGLAKKAVPDTLPPEMKSKLTEAKGGLLAGYRTYGDALAAINTFITEKKPLALLEYKQKSSQAKEYITAANDKLNKAMTSAGIAPP